MKHTLPFAWALPPIGGQQQSSHGQQSNKPFWLGPFGDSAPSADLKQQQPLPQQPQQQQQQQPQLYQQQQPQQQPHNPSSSSGSSSSSGGGGGSANGNSSGNNSSSSGGHHHDLPLQAAKLAGVVAAHVLIHLASWQRSAPEHGEDFHRRLPWRHLRLPWHHGGGAGADGARGGKDGAARGGGAKRQRALECERARRFVAQGISAERAMRLREALECYQAALALDPDNLEYICRVAKQYSDLSYEDGATAASVVEANTLAMEYADKAIALAPEVGGWRDGGRWRA